MTNRHSTSKYTCISIDKVVISVICKGKNNISNKNSEIHCRCLSIFNVEKSWINCKLQKLCIYFF